MKRYTMILTLAILAVVIGGLGGAVLANEGCPCSGACVLACGSSDNCCMCGYSQSTCLTCSGSTPWCTRWDEGSNSCDGKSCIDRGKANCSAGSGC